jgi:hypothetical protein
MLKLIFSSIFIAVSQYNGQVTLPDIADLYETLGKFLKDLGQLNQVSLPFWCLFQESILSTVIS